MKILFVEDEKPLSTALHYKLEHEGIEHEMAEDGVEALKKIEEHDFDLIVTDIIMPEMDGWQLIDEIRKTSSVPILILSNTIIADKDVKHENVTHTLKSNIRLEKIVSMLYEITKPNSKKTEGGGKICGNQSTVRTEQE